FSLENVLTSGSLSLISKHIDILKRLQLLSVQLRSQHIVVTCVTLLYRLERFLEYHILVNGAIIIIQYGCVALKSSQLIIIVLLVRFIILFTIFLDVFNRS